MRDEREREKDRERQRESGRERGREEDESRVRDYMRDLEERCRSLHAMLVVEFIQEVRAGRERHGWEL